MIYSINELNSLSPYPVLSLSLFVCCCRDFCGLLLLSLYYCFNSCPYVHVYVPTNLAGVSGGSQMDMLLWPTHATWSHDPNDSGVYCATTPGYAVIHTLNHHAAVIAIPAGPSNLPGLVVYEVKCCVFTTCCHMLFGSDKWSYQKRAMVSKVAAHCGVAVEFVRNKCTTEELRDTWIAHSKITPGQA